MKKTIELDLPIFVEFPDYHIESYLEEPLRKMNLRIKEMYCEDMDYKFAIYFPEQEEEINNMIKEYYDHEFDPVWKGKIFWD